MVFALLVSLTRNKTNYCQSLVMLFMLATLMVVSFSTRVSSFTLITSITTTKAISIHSSSISLSLLLSSSSISSPSSLYSKSNDNDLFSNVKKNISNFGFLTTTVNNSNNNNNNSNNSQQILSKEEQSRFMTTEEILSNLGMKSSIEPKVAYVDPDRFYDVATAAIPFVLRLGSGSFVQGYEVGFTQKDETKYVPYNIAIGDQLQLYEKSKYVINYNRQPRGPIILYEFEACPFCRKVREAVSILELDVEFRPCVQGSKYRKEIKDEYGYKATFPFMKDPNTGIEMFESDAIIAYLFRLYGSSKKVDDVPSSLTGGVFTTLMTSLSLLLRFGKGSKGKYSNPPPKPLILWSAEGTPFGKLVREELNELQVAHIQISCPRGGSNRQKMFEQTNGVFQIPYLEDPNNGVKLFESSAIIEYLQKMYGVKSSVVEYI